MPINYALFENNLTSDPNDYAAQVQITASADLSAIVKRIIDQGSTSTEADIACWRTPSRPARRCCSTAPASTSAGCATSTRACAASSPALPTATTPRATRSTSAPTPVRRSAPPSAPRPRSARSRPSSPRPPRSNTSIWAAARRTAQSPPATNRVAATNLTGLRSRPKRVGNRDQPGRTPQPAQSRTGTK